MARTNNNRNYELDKAVCAYIIKAQMCSDAGKRIYEEYEYPSWRKEAKKWGYSHKDKFIKLACQKICQLKGRSGFHFYLYLWDWCPIIYFNFKLDGKRHQVSFHCPRMSDADIKKWADRRTSHHETRWDGNLGGSRYACWLLGEYLRKEVKI